MVGPGRPGGGFHEVVAIVADLDRTLAGLEQAFGYQRLWRGAADASSLAFMGLAGARAEEALAGDAEQGRGYFRLLQFEDTEAGVMRDGAQPWDVGGIFDVNIRPLRSIEEMHGRMVRAGFVAFAPMTAYDFSGMKVKEVVSRNADGVAVALIQQDAPPLTGFEQVRGPASYVFNSTQTVRSFEAARAFYVDRLGWKPVYETSWTHPGAGENCLGLPLALAREKRLKVGIYHPEGLNEGSVEVLEVEGVEGMEFSARSKAPNRGLAALRFPVRSIDQIPGLAAEASAEITMEPYGVVRARAVTTDWGARLEFYEAP